MSSSLIELRISMARAMDVTVTEEALTVDLEDARTISAPISWYPRLAHGTPEERDNWRIIDMGGGIHWPDLDEDISVENLLTGSPSGESRRSLKRWLERRARGEKIEVETLDLPPLDIEDLSAEERIMLAQEIWDSFEKESDALPPLTEAQKKELDRRLANHRANKGNLKTWNEVKQKLLSSENASSS